jgi:hypothetical protein
MKLHTFNNDCRSKWFGLKRWTPCPCGCDFKLGTIKCYYFIWLPFSKKTFVVSFFDNGETLNQWRKEKGYKAV